MTRLRPCGAARAGQLSFAVVPDSATGELAGLSGRMAILIDGGRHSYEFDYEFGSPP